MSAGTPADPDPSLLVVLDADDRRWWLGARRVHAEFHAMRGLVGARFTGGAACGRLGWSDAGASARTWASPRAARFERSSPAGSFLETIWLPERLGALVIEARPVGGWIPGRTLLAHLDGAHLDGAPPIHLLAFGGDTPLATVEAAREGEGVDLPLEPPARHTPITLVIHPGEPHPSTLRSLLVLGAHARRALPAHEAPSLRSGIDEVDAGVSWAWTRIRDRLLDGAGLVPPLEPADAAEWIRTALAAGLPEAARAALPDTPLSPPGIEAWYAWASGAGDAARASFEALEARLGDGAGLPRADRLRLADAAERAGSEAWARRLRTSGERSSVRLSLPSLRDAPPSPSADETLGAWRNRLTDAAGALAPEGWRILGTVIDTLLGYHADAATGRLHLSPTPPAHWTRLAVEGVGMGDARMTLTFRREGADEEWRFAPIAGGVPLTLILRLRVPDRAARVTVDGTLTDLEIEEARGEARAPIQLQLTGERVVRISGGSPEADTTSATLTSRVE
ncbi:MAG: hypothetical protein RQ745_14020 [Longimicrobiales bacterium]|nr:hypothetical protein [Longimicrobiales bacterium]